jgi:hypothetical protein
MSANSGCNPHFLLLDFGSKGRHALHLISLHMHYEERCILLYAGCSIYEDIYYSIIYLQSYMFKLMLNQL